jgi:Flp pilus assembly protein TadB
VLVVISAVVIRNRAADRAGSGPSRTAEEGSLQAATEDCTQSRSTSAADQRSFTGSYAAATTVLVVMVMAALVILRVTVVITALNLLVHAAVVVVVTLIVPSIPLRSACGDIYEQARCREQEQLAHTAQDRNRQRTNDRAGANQCFAPD